MLPTASKSLRPKREQPQVTFDDIAVGNAMQQGQLIDRGLHPREPNGAPQEREARVCGMDFL